MNIYHDECCIEYYKQDYIKLENWFNLIITKV